MNTTEIIEAIENGQQKEKWDEWLNHESKHVRYALVYQGYNLEHFIDDDHKTIRAMVMEKKPNLIPDIISKHPEDIYTAERIIANDENATLENLKYICNSKATDATPLEVRAYNTKIQSLETKPTLLESTMSISELFATKNALWAKPYNVTQIYQIQRYPKILKKMNHQPVLMTNTIFVDEHEHEAVRIKYQTTKASVTNLEATMTTYQLYKSNNILWAKNLTLNQIEKVLYIAQSETMMEKDDVIREILEGKTEC